MNLIKEGKTSNHCADFKKDSFEKYSKENLKNIEFSEFKKVNKKEFLSILEIKKHHELKGVKMQHRWNKNLCKIQGKWYDLNDIKAIIPKRFLMSNSLHDYYNYLLIKTSNDDNVAIIAGYTF